MSRNRDVPAKRIRDTINILGTVSGPKGQFPADPHVLDLVQFYEGLLSGSPKRKAAKKAKGFLRALEVEGKRELRQGIREAVFARSGGKCECGCGMWFDDLNPMEMDHWRGKHREESVETCWGLRRDHHLLRTRNQPSAAYWIEKFVEHCARHGYRAAAAQALSRRNGIVAIREHESESRERVQEGER